MSKVSASKVYAISHVVLLSIPSFRKRVHRMSKRQEQNLARLIQRKIDVLKPLILDCKCKRCNCQNKTKKTDGICHDCEKGKHQR